MNGTRGTFVGEEKCPKYLIGKLEGRGLLEDVVMARIILK
jgi:hypothetical protein